MTEGGAGEELPAGTRLGRVALTVGSLSDVLPFYRDVLGFTVSRDGARATLSAGDRPCLVLVEDAGAPARASDAAGLFHVAVRVPDRAALADVLARVEASDAALTGASDHLVSEALYLRDPEGNGVEVYRDRPRAEWPRDEDGSPDIGTLPFDRSGLASATTGRRALPVGTDVGHVHLEVTDLERATAFYVGALGFRIQERIDGGVFVAADGYHHHVALNTWQSRRAPADPAARGLRWFEIMLPDETSRTVVSERVENAGYEVRETERDAVEAVDPDGMWVRFVTERR
ncbi:VOC family protein [Halarchaeum sp. P4]|uniref:VOC family protein n=1 Tax=Halarchaeum sp. P4 TaxID=3421639 RepID=UPI003EB9951A